MFQYAATERGDMLIFLSGMSEIMSVVEAARMYAEQSKGWIILPLHSALSIPEQDKVRNQGRGQGFSQDQGLSHQGS